MTAALPFDRMGPYQIERVLGRGGMGMVFAARHRETGEAAAVKVLSPALAISGSFRERFDAEIESLRQLRHANIVRLYGFGEERGHLFYAMELVNGRTLQEELSAGRRFNWREVAGIALQVCSALKHAHDHGIVHRDLKPANLLWTADEQVKLSDFGIAKLFGATLVTQGGVLGTADYMAPEQASGESSGNRCDLYSLGAVMYALLTGKPPHSGKSVAEVLHKLRFEQPIPVGRLAIDVPDELETIVMQLIAKNPRQRIPTALAVQNRLLAMQHALSIHPEEGDSSKTAFPHQVADNADGLAQQPTVAVELDSRGRPVDPHLDASILSTAISDADEGDRPAPRTHFTPVSELPASVDIDPESTWIRAATVVGLATALVIVVVLVGYTVAPPTADTLYQRVVHSANSEQAVSLGETRSAAEQFLERFPHDARREEVLEIRQEIELEQLERRLEWLAGHPRPGHGLSAAEQIYLDAVRLAPHQPLEAARRLRALVQIASHAPADDETLHRMGQLAEERLENLQKQVDETVSEHRTFILQALDQADALATTDPEAAEQIRRGLSALYGDKAWAQDLLDQK